MPMKPASRSPHAPKRSTTAGQKDEPVCLHTASYLATFLLSTAEAATARVRAEPALKEVAEAGHVTAASR